MKKEVSSRASEWLRLEVQGTNRTDRGIMSLNEGVRPHELPVRTMEPVIHGLMLSSLRGKSGFPLLYSPSCPGFQVEVLSTR